MFAYVKTDLKQGKFAGWILAQGIGRINQASRHGKIVNLCFCISTIHLVQNISDPYITRENTYFFAGYFSQNVLRIAEKLGFRSDLLSGSRVLTFLIAHVCRGHRFMLWIPHLGVEDYTPFVRSFIGELYAFQSVQYIDDGMGFLSRDTLIYQRGYIPSFARIYSWDFMALPSDAGLPLTTKRSHFQRAIEVARTAYSFLLDQGLNQVSQHMQLRHGIPVEIVLSSKLLDVDFCLRNLVQCYPPYQAFYIPHYNGNKNYEQLASTLHNLSLEIPELGLLGIAEHLPCRIFFGVTSSIVILIEMLLRLNSTVHVELIYAGHDDRQDAHSSELMCFKKLLIHYQQLDVVREKCIDIVI